MTRLEVETRNSERDMKKCQDKITSHEEEKTEFEDSMKKIVARRQEIEVICSKVTVYLFIYVCIYLFIYLSIYLFIYLCIYLFIYLCIYLFIYLCIYWFSLLNVRSIVNSISFFKWFHYSIRLSYQLSL